MNLCINGIIQLRISYIKVVSKYVGNRVPFYPPSIKTYTGVVLQRKEMTSLIGSLLNMRAPKILYCHALFRTNKQSMANKKSCSYVSTRGEKK